MKTSRVYLSIPIITVLICGLGIFLAYHLYWFNDFKVSYSGVATGNFRGKGEFDCSRTGVSTVYPIINLTTPGGDTNSVTIRLASNVKIGTYAFSKTPVWGEAYLISAAVTTKDGQEYGASVEHLVSGEIIINDLPNNSKQHLKGRFEATFETGNGQRIIIRGNFDFQAGMSINECRNIPLRSDWPD